MRLANLIPVFFCATALAQWSGSLPATTNFPPLGENDYLTGHADGPCVYPGGVTMDGPAQLPQQCMYTGMDGTPAPGTYIEVNSTTDFINALSTVQCGQHIRLHVSSGPFIFTSGQVLPALNCDVGHWVWIESDQLSANNPLFPAEHTIATPCNSNQASVPGYPQYDCPTPNQTLAQFQCTGNVFCLRMATGANFYRIIGLDIYCNPQTPSNITSACVDLSNNLSGGSDHIILDRTLVHGQTITCPATSTGAVTCTSRDTDRGVFGANSTYVAFINGWIYEIGTPLGTTVDTVAFPMGGNNNGTSEDVKKLYNVVISAGGESWFSGGGGSTATITPNDFMIRRVHSLKPVSWLNCIGGTANGCAPSITGGAYKNTIKNLGELKNANRVLVEGIVFENSWQTWQGDQAGFAALLTPKNQAWFLVTPASSDATGTILTGNFPAGVVDAKCAQAYHCAIWLTPPGGTRENTYAQTWNAGPPVTITVSPAVSPNLVASPSCTGAGNWCVTYCQPGLAPNAHVTNVTFRYIEIRNVKNGVALAAALSDCGDFSQGVADISIHDVLMSGINWSNCNFPSASQSCYNSAACFAVTNVNVPPAQLHNFEINHVTCAQPPVRGGSNSGLDSVFDQSDPGCVGNQFLTGRIQTNNLGVSGGLSRCGLGSATYPPANSGLNVGIVAQSGTSWTYTRNVLGIGQSVIGTQNTGLPFPPSNADPGDTPPGTGCNQFGASCHPSGAAFTSLFREYNGSEYVLGYQGDYELVCPGPYCTASIDGLPIGANVAKIKALTAGVNSTILYTPAAITTASLAPASNGTPYQQLLSATSAGPMQQWFVTGNLPAGVALASCGNVWCLTGTPTVSGSFPLTFQMMDAAQQTSAPVSLTLTVN